LNKENVRQSIEQGNLIKCNKKEYTKVRDWLQQVAGEYIDSGDGLRSMIALNEVQRLDSWFNFVL